jgi:protein-tyrosine phosphatase
MQMSENQIKFGLINFRDLGGLETVDGKKVKEKLLYRAALLSNVPASAGKFISAEYNIGNVIDLRSRVEVKQRPVLWTDNCDISYTSLPFSDGFMHIPEQLTKDELDELIWRRYFDYLEYARDDIKNALENISNAALNGIGTVYACVFGKDRTGVLTAIILEILGVKRDEIIEDYLLSQNSMSDLKNILASDPLHGPKLISSPKEIYEARHNIITKFLDELDKIGGSTEWAKRIGVEDQILNMLRQNLLETDPIDNTKEN